MKDYINYYSNKDTFDEVAKILIDEINNRINYLQENLVAELEYISSEQIERTRDQVGYLKTALSALEISSEHLITIDLHKLEKNLGKGFSAGEEPLTDIVFKELEQIKGGEQ